MYLAEKKHENVYYYKDVIPDHKKLIEMIESTELLDDIVPAIPKWNPWYSSSYDKETFGTRKDVNIEAIPRLDGEAKEVAEYIYNTMSNGFKDVINSFIKDRGLDIENPNASSNIFLDILKYVPGCELGSHFDAQDGDKSLVWSIVLYLNDEYEGGELSWKIGGYQGPRATSIFNESENNKDLVDFWIKPEAGSALIFPSTYPYFHQVHRTMAGERYISTGFIFVDDYNPRDPASVAKYRGGGESKQRDTK